MHSVFFTTGLTNDTGHLATVKSQTGVSRALCLPLRSEKWYFTVQLEAVSSTCNHPNTGVMSHFGQLKQLAHFQINADAPYWYYSVVETSTTALKSNAEILVF